MIVVLTILLGYAVLFYLLSREGIEVWENLQGLVLMSPIIVWVIQLVNWLFGTELGQDAWFFTWLGLFLAWTLVCIWFLIYEYRKRRKRARLWQKLMNSEEY